MASPCRPSAGMPVHHHATPGSRHAPHAPGPSPSAGGGSQWRSRGSRSAASEPICQTAVGTGQAHSHWLLQMGRKHLAGTGHGSGAAAAAPCPTHQTPTARKSSPLPLPPPLPLALHRCSSRSRCALPPSPCALFQTKQPEQRAWGGTESHERHRRHDGSWASAGGTGTGGRLACCCCFASHHPSPTSSLGLLGRSSTHLLSAPCARALRAAPARCTAGQGVLPCGAARRRALPPAAAATAAPQGRTAASCILLDAGRT